MSKKNRPKTTVNVDAVKKDIKKVAKNITKSSPTDHVELAPGSVRRESPLEQQMGSRKYREMIHAHNSKNKHILDRLPFTFPKKRKIRSHLDVALECPECGAYLSGSEQTYMVVCSSCKQVVKPYNHEAERLGIHKGPKNSE